MFIYVYHLRGTGYRSYIYVNKSMLLKHCIDQTTVSINYRLHFHSACQQINLLYLILLLLLYKDMKLPICNPHYIYIIRIFQNILIFHITGNK